MFTFPSSTSLYRNIVGKTLEMLANLKNTCFVKNVQKKQHKHVKNKRAFRDEQTYPGR